MDIGTIRTASNIIFLVVIALLAIISLLTAYVLIRYGQSKTFTIIISMAFGGLFFLGALTAFVTMQQLF